MLIKVEIIIIILKRDVLKTLKLFNTLYYLFVDKKV